MATATAAPVRKIKGENANLIRQVWDEVEENADVYVERFPGLDVRGFKRGITTFHGKVFATIRKRKMNPGEAATTLINKFLGTDANGAVAVDDLLAELAD